MHRRDLEERSARAHVSKEAREIADSNATCGRDSIGADFATEREAFLAYLQNVIDTTEERTGVSVIEAVDAFVQAWRR
jgi:hypothetical protein